MKETKKVIHDRDQERFYIKTSCGEAAMNYTVKKGVMEIYHTVVPVNLRGRGIAFMLAEKAALTARKEGLRIKPVCSFMAVFLKKSTKYSQLKK